MFFRKLLRLSILIVVLISSLSLAVVPSMAQSPYWSQPVQLGAGWFPDVAADLAGKVHVVWASTHNSTLPTPTPAPGATPNPFNGYDVVMYTSSQDGITWTQANDIIARPQQGGSEATRPTILVDPQGILHMTFRDTRVYYDAVPVQSAAIGSAWPDPYTINSDQIGYFSRMAIDSKGKIHLVFTENLSTPSCNLCYHLYYRSSLDGQNWSFKQDISVLPTGAAKPQILIDKKDNLYVVWEAGQGGAYGQLSDPTSCFFTASYDGGKTWTTPREFSQPSSQSKDITIGMDGNGNLVVAWLDLPSDQVISSTSSDQGKTWSSAQPIPGIFGGWAIYNARLDDYSMATDSAGNIHLVLVARSSDRQTTLDVMHLIWDGYGWSTPEVITTLRGDVPEWPRLAIGNGNQLNVVWFVRDQAHIFDSDHGVYTVWYSRETANAPSSPAITWPTATPTLPAKDFLPKPTPTATPLPLSLKATPVSAGLVNTFYSENSTYITVGTALIPAAGLLLLVLAIIRIRRR